MSFLHFVVELEWLELGKLVAMVLEIWNNKNIEITHPKKFNWNVCPSFRWIELDLIRID